MGINAGEDNVGITHYPRYFSNWVFPRGRWCYCSRFTNSITGATAIFAVAFLFYSGRRYV